MRILPIIARLKANCALLANRVEPAKSLTALSDEEVKTGLPIAFVYSAKEGGNPSDLVGKTSQRVAKRFTVIIAAKTSDATTEYMEDVRDQIKAGLIGWPVSATHEAVEFIGGEIINVTGGVEWWKDTYETFTYNRG
jgi:hypothetical protein